MREHKNFTVNVDHYGRIVIEDPELLAVISGATELVDLVNADAACGNNDNCNNTSC